MSLAHGDMDRLVRVVLISRRRVVSVLAEDGAVLGECLRFDPGAVHLYPQSRFSIGLPSRSKHARKRRLYLGTHQRDLGLPKHLHEPADVRIDHLLEVVELGLQACREVFEHILRPLRGHSVRAAHD